eukprot:jgi/Galph1/3025/GphlegSOOS_G1678.1
MHRRWLFQISPSLWQPKRKLPLVFKYSRRQLVSLISIFCGKNSARKTLAGSSLSQLTFQRVMAWLSRGRTQEELVQSLKVNGLIKSEEVEKAMLAVDRALFCNYRPYEDSPQPIGYNATISAPHMHATCLELLKDHLKPGNKVLDVGSGSGYLTACMGLMVAPNGVVVGVEHIPGLAKQSIDNIEKSQKNLLDSGVMKILTSDGRLGYSEEAPYHAIHVGAAAGDVPRELLEQLLPGGRMIIPVGTWEQELVQYDKKMDGTVLKKHITFVRYVPLCSPEQQVRGL